MNTLLLILGLVPIWQEMPNVTIVQDSSITQLMEDYWVGRVYKETTVAGWRVQIFSSNDPRNAKSEAEAMKKKLENEIDQPIFVNYMQPFWKVRIGNFQSMEEAKTYRDELVKTWPELQGEAYPVRDKIKVMKQ